MEFRVSLIHSWGERQDGRVNIVGARHSCAGVPGCIRLVKG